MGSTSVYAIRDTGGVAFKADFIRGAYSRLRISGLSVDPTPEDLDLALNRLEQMMDEWQSKNLKTQYFFETYPNPNTYSGVIRAYWNAIETNLAIRLATDFNIAIHPSLSTQAKQAYSNMSGRILLQNTREVEYPARQARGSGSTRWFNRWHRFYRLEPSTPTAGNSRRLFIGDIEDYTENFDAFLRSEETIAAHFVIVDPGLDLISDSHTENEIKFRLEADSDNGELQNQQVTLIVDTDSGRRHTRTLLFELVGRDRTSFGSSDLHDIPPSGSPGDGEGGIGPNLMVSEIPPQTGSLGTPFSIDLNDYFTAMPEAIVNLTISINSIPSWATLSNGVFSGTPTTEESIELITLGCIPFENSANGIECVQTVWTLTIGN